MAHFYSGSVGRPAATCWPAFVDLRVRSRDEDRCGSREIRSLPPITHEAPSTIKKNPWSLGEGICVLLTSISSTLSGSCGAGCRNRPRKLRYGNVLLTMLAFLLFQGRVGCLHLLASSLFGTSMSSAPSGPCSHI